MQFYFLFLQTFFLKASIFFLFYLQKQMISNKKIHKYKKINTLQLPIKSKSKLRNQLKKEFVSPTFKNSIWRTILNTYKREKFEKTQNFKNVVKEHRDFTCSICFNLMIFPVVLVCGHAFCLPCIQQATLTQDKCCLCRKQIQQEYFSVSQQLSKLIEANRVPQLDKQQLSEYRSRYNNFVIWQHIVMIHVQSFKIGLNIHFQDKQDEGWRYGVITDVKPIGMDLYFKVQPLYKQSPEECFQFHYLSRKIARFQFFRYTNYFKQIAIWTGSPSRDKKLRQVIQKRIRDGTIYEAYDHPWKGQQGDYINVDFARQNIVKYLPPKERNFNYNTIAAYNFDDFHNDIYIDYQKEELGTNNQIGVQPTNI